MIGPQSLFRSKAKTFAKEAPLAQTFKNKDGFYFGHLNDEEPTKVQNDNFDFIEDNLAE